MANHIWGGISVVLGLVSLGIAINNNNFTWIVISMLAAAYIVAAVNTALLFYFTKISNKTINSLNEKLEEKSNEITSLENEIMALKKENAQMIQINAYIASTMQGTQATARKTSSQRPVNMED